MDSDLYDEFGNYIGPELESDEDEDSDEQQERAANEEEVNKSTGCWRTSDFSEKA